MSLFKTPKLINNAERLLTLPCARIPSIWVDMAIETAIAGFIAYVSPDPKHYYHMARGRTLTCDIKGGVEDMIRESPAADSAAKRFFFKNLEWADKLLWWAFIAEALYDGAVDATSNAMKNLCQDHKARENSTSGSSEFGGLNKDGSWQTADFWVYDGDHSLGSTSSSVTVGPGDHWYIAGHAGWRLAHLDTVGGAFGRLICKETNQIYDLDSAFPELEGAAHTLMWAHGRNNSDYERTYSMEWSFVGGQSEPGTAMVLSSGFLSKYPLRNT